MARFSLVELIIALAILVLIIAVIFAIIMVCRCLKMKRCVPKLCLFLLGFFFTSFSKQSFCCSSEDGKYGDHVHAVTHVRNPHSVPPVVTAPPPLPPRAFRGGNQMISNLEQAQLTGLPTVQVWLNLTFFGLKLLC